MFTGLPAKHEGEKRASIALNSLEKMQQKCEVKLQSIELDQNYIGSLAGFLEYKKDLVLALLDGYFNTKN